VPAYIDRLDEHVGQARAWVRVEVLDALHPVVRPGQGHQEPVVAAQDLAWRDDVQCHAEHGGVEIAGQDLVAIAILHRISCAEPERYRDVRARRRLRSRLEAGIAFELSPFNCAAAVEGRTKRVTIATAVASVQRRCL
jgi:hypothetical protein